MPELSGPRREEVIRLKQEGMSNSRISLALGISRQRVGQIVRSAMTSKPKVSSPEALLSTAQAARILNVHINTVRRWSNTTLLPSYRIGTRGDRRFRWVDIQRMLRQGVMKDVQGVIEGISYSKVARDGKPEPVAEDARQ